MSFSRLSARGSELSMNGVDEVLSQLAMTDIVVATRFHNVLLSLMLKKPVIAISFHHKCTSLMREMGLSAYCQEIEQLDPQDLIAQLQDLERHSDEVRQAISRKVEEFRRALDEQYERLFEARESEFGQEGNGMASAAEPMPGR
jgi:polysaccharide pyruvyl transferase WcaK-like protein